MKHSFLRIYIVLFLSFLGSLSVVSQSVKTEKTDTIEVSLIDSVDISTSFNDSTALPWEQKVQKHLSQLLNKKMFTTSQIGMMVYDLTADSVLFKHNEKQLLRPASTMKTLTAITAIDKLGGSFQFKTHLCYTGNISNKTLTGNIYCVGGFDPMFNNDDMSAFVQSIKRLNVDTIRGVIYADKSMKTTDLLGEGWCWDDKNPTLSPLLIGGKDVFIDKFAKELQEVGIYLEVSFGSATRPQNAICIESRFHTIDQVLMKMMKDSNNLYAEAMFYQLAALSNKPFATAKDARLVIQRLITKLKKTPSQYKIADGSGLSLYNYVSAELQIEFLKYAYHNKNIYLHLAPSLPIAGVDGTLKDRMRNTSAHGNVMAKTGTLTGISSLAGYCTAPNGHILCFSIINQGVLNNNSGRIFQNKVCIELCTE